MKYRAGIPTPDILAELRAQRAAFGANDRTQYDTALRLQAAWWRQDARRWSRREPSPQGRWAVSCEAGAQYARNYALAIYHSLQEV